MMGVLLLCVLTDLWIIVNLLHANLDGLIFVSMVGLYSIATMNYLYKLSDIAKAEGESDEL